MHRYLSMEKDPALVTRTGFVRAFAIALTVVLLGYAVAQLFAVAQGAMTRGELGHDANLYLTSAQRWLATGDFYYPAQTAPYPVSGTVIMYPPVALYLFTPLSFLPRILWWAIPLTILGWHLWACRPAWWSWPILAGLCATLPVSAGLAYGNTEMWTAAAIAIACRFAPAALFLAIKPTVFPLALVFARDKRWWYGLAVLIALCIPFGDLWVDYVIAMLNVEGANPLYSLPALVWFGIPLVAWWGRR
jgi:hypothetical protein